MAELPFQKPELPFQMTELPFQMPETKSNLINKYINNLYIQYYYTIR
jgi:hypothetical protein